MGRSKKVNIKALRKLLADATPGPWIDVRDLLGVAEGKPREFPLHFVVGENGHGSLTLFWGPNADWLLGGEDGDGTVTTHERDIVLAVALRNAAPDLLDELESLRRKVRGIKR